MDRSIRIKIWLIMLVGVILPRAGWSNELVPAGYRSIATEQGVPHTVLYAIALTESGKQIKPAGGHRPWPWTLNLAGRGYFFDSRLEAWQALTGWIGE
ncbi:MAG TPA: lytic transglycosylase domain-containing protein, partial [Gammaproteobacteria bacterium]|nr:lytic transglycosylase domain-containing protein [Gammaproteobacteria bacterium]